MACFVRVLAQCVRSTEQRGHRRVESSAEGVRGADEILSASGAGVDFAHRRVVSEDVVLVLAARHQREAGCVERP